jgi:iron complex transport system substrate-binding protein
MLASLFKHHFFLALLTLIFCCSSSAEIIVKDDTQQTVILKKPAQRIVSLAPNITEILFFIGAGEAIVGADEYSNYPEEAKKILRVSNYAAANYELILALKPDVVIAWQTGNGSKIIDRLRQLGLKVFVIEPRKLKDIPLLFKRFGKITGQDKHAVKKALEFDNKLQQLVISHQNKPVVNVFYQIWNEPLITLNGKHIVSDVISLCGGHNVFSDALPLVPYVSSEAVVRANPDVIIAGGSNEELPSLLTMWENWPAMKAVKNKHVYVIPPDLMQRHSMRIIQGAKRLCQYLNESRPNE